MIMETLKILIESILPVLKPLKKSKCGEVDERGLQPGGGVVRYLNLWHWDYTVKKLLDWSKYVYLAVDVLVTSKYFTNQQFQKLK